MKTKTLNLVTKFINHVELQGIYILTDDEVTLIDNELLWSEIDNYLLKYSIVLGYDKSYNNFICYKYS